MHFLKKELYLLVFSMSPPCVGLKNKNESGGMCMNPCAPGSGSTAPAAFVRSHGSVLFCACAVFTSEMMQS